MIPIMGLVKIRGWRVARLLGVGLAGFFILFYLFLESLPGSRPIGKSLLLDALIQIKQVSNGVMARAYDSDLPIADRIVYPADSGAKSNLEYVRFLITKGVFKESDLPLFCKPDRTIKKIADLRAEDLAVRFANVSINDPGETIFGVIRVRGQKSWWEFWQDAKEVETRKVGYALIRLDGSGIFYQKPLEDLNTLTPLPPREPKFLNP